MFWPCPDEVPEGVTPPGAQGTPRLFEPGSWNPVARGAGPFYFSDGTARFNVTPYIGPAEDVDDEYPVILTTGRVVSQFLSGNPTRRMGPLVDHYPEPRMEMHPVSQRSWGSRTVTGRPPKAAAAALLAWVATFLGMMRSALRQAVQSARTP